MHLGCRVCWLVLDLQPGRCAVNITASRFAHCCGDQQVFTKHELSCKAMHSEAAIGEAEVAEVIQALHVLLA